MLTCVALFADATQAQTAQEPFTPQVGQEGKDVVWVPTPDILVQTMLDLAKLTPQDFVVDLGSGDGRMIIAAAKRGARALGVEYNPKMVELSKRSAADAGVADKAQFVQGDMFEADFSQANVLALFLLPDNLNKLRPKFLDLKPGTRIVSNTFEIDGWQPDAVESLEGSTCQGWCSALLWIVPAKVEGTWRLPDGALVLKQSFQMVSGTLRIGSNLTTIANGSLRGEEITFSAGGAEYTGHVKGDSIEGAVTSGGRKDTWIANRLP